MVAALMTGSDLAKFLTGFTSLLVLESSPQEGSLGEDEIEESLGVIRRLAAQALHEGFEQSPEGAVLLYEFAVGCLQRLDALTILDIPGAQALDLRILALSSGHEAGEPGVEALGLRLLLQLVALLAVRPELPEEVDRIADRGDDRASAEGVGDAGYCVHASPPSDAVDSAKRAMVADETLPPARKPDRAGRDEQSPGPTAGGGGQRLLPGEHGVGQQAGAHEHDAGDLDIVAALEFPGEHEHGARTDEDAPPHGGHEAEAFVAHRGEGQDPRGNARREDVHQYRQELVRHGHAVRVRRRGYGAHAPNS